MQNTSPHGCITPNLQLQILPPPLQFYGIPEDPLEESDRECGVLHQEVGKAQFPGQRSSTIILLKVWNCILRSDSAFSFFQKAFTSSKQEDILLSSISIHSVFNVSMILSKRYCHSTKKLIIIICESRSAAYRIIGRTGSSGCVPFHQFPDATLKSTNQCKAIKFH